MRRLGLIVKSRRDRITQSWSQLKKKKCKTKRATQKHFFQALTKEKPAVSDLKIKKERKKQDLNLNTLLKNWRYIFFFCLAFIISWQTGGQPISLHFYHQIFSFAALLHQVPTICAEEVHGSLLGAFRGGTKYISGSTFVRSDFSKNTDESFILGSSDVRLVVQHGAFVMFWKRDRVQLGFLCCKCFFFKSYLFFQSIFSANMCYQPPNEKNTST